jgi:channel protein (hemolysin III family)
MLSMSGVYHLLSPDGVGRIVFQRLDHSAIFILIVGTMTPIHKILFEGLMRWGWLLLVWLIAITTLTLKTIFFTSFPEWLGLVLFLCLGWLGIVSVGIVWYRRDMSFIKLLLFGGLAYTVGAILEFFQEPILIPGVLGPHELFHITVLVGLGLHWKFIYNITRMSRFPIKNQDKN